MALITAFCVGDSLILRSWQCGKVCFKKVCKFLGVPLEIRQFRHVNVSKLRS